MGEHSPNYDSIGDPYHSLLVEVAVATGDKLPKLSRAAAHDMVTDDIVTFAQLADRLFIDGHCMTPAKAAYLVLDALASAAAGRLAAKQRVIDKLVQNVEDYLQTS